MQTILIVDDEPRLLQSISAGLKVHENSFLVMTAANGEEAVAILSSTPIDLLITDLKMPKMDGFELLVHVSTNYPTLPAIVMTAFSTPDIEQKIEESNSLKLLEKPIDFDELADSIFEILERSADEGSLTGISLASFLQLLETEKKTCLIEIQSNKEKGYIYFNQGELYSAVFGAIKAEEAVYHMLMYDEVEIRIKKHIKKKYKKTVEKRLFPLLMEGMRRKDEMRSEEEADQLSPLPNSSSELGEYQHEKGSLPSLNSKTIEGDHNMSALDETMEKLAEVEGFMAVGIFTPNGEMAAQLNKSGLKLDEIGSLANDVLLKAQKATDMMDVGRGQLVHVEAPKAHIIARCLNENTDFSESEAGKAHMHMVLILAKDGNLAMAKMKLASIIQEAAPAFR
jgi:DNA-binding response OmpR family regulator/predicted regulator of Ras-like GTPase activity (Roadblock/LC7/MglB family)